MKTPEQQLAERGKRLWKQYRITLSQYDELFRLQNGKCYLCGKPPKTVSLAVDHFHFKITTYKISYLRRRWCAETHIDNCLFTVLGKTKKEAIEKLKNLALPASIRGLLCTGHMGCNKKIGRVDNVIFLRKVIEYLENPPAKKILLDKTPTI